MQERLPLTKRIGFSIFMAALVSALVPSMIIGISGLLSLRSELMDSAAQALQSRTGAIARGIDDKILNLSKTIDILAGDPILFGKSLPVKMEYLHGFLDLNPLFFSVFQYDLQGFTQAAAFRNRQIILEEKYLGKNILKTTAPSMEELRRLLKDKIFTNGILPEKSMETQGRLPVTIIVQDGERMLIIARPIPDFAGKTIAGALSCAVRLEGAGMDELLSNYPLGKDEFIILTDSSGRVMASAGKSTLPPGLKQIEMSSEPRDNNSVTGINIGTERYLGVLSKVESLNGFVLCARPKARVFNVLTQSSINLSLVLLTAIALAIFISFRLSRSIGTRIQELARGIGLVGQGILSHRVQDLEDDELGQAARAFNDMAASLEKNRFIDETWSRLDSMSEEPEK